jgi:hypothetical protein
MQMPEPSSFSRQPDRAMGAMLRDVLDEGNDPAFLARVRLAVAQAGRETSWDVLARWAPAGLVAAGIAAGLVWMLLRVVGDPTQGSMLASAPVQIEVSPQQPEADVLTANLLEGR